MSTHSGAYKKSYRENRRKIVLEKYGGKCLCCGETQQEFLTIDHVNGKLGRWDSGDYLIARLLNSSVSCEYRILCYNCNCSLGHRGYCPHQSRGGFNEGRNNQS
jgi:hypothetical protein